VSLDVLIHSENYLIKRDFIWGPKQLIPAASPSAAFNQASLAKFPE
jgi:hypothetical protein